MKKKSLIFFIACLFSTLILLALRTNYDCAKIKIGHFYFYPNKGQYEFAIIREDSIQREINLKTGDTSFWKINWQDACSFNLKFIRKSTPISDDEKYFYNSHITVFRILKVKKDYYLFMAGLDSVNNKNAFKDTMWFKPKSDP